jgi:peptide/nickel transport system substrate-binding protein
MSSRGTAALGCLFVALIWVSVWPVTGLSAGEARGHQPEGEMRWALHVTLSPSWFDPGDVVGLLTPFLVFYALHDAVVKPMPGDLMTPSLTESWTVSDDQRVYKFR